MKTRAAVVYGLNQPFVVKDLELEAPKAREVLVHLAASGVCHSDWHHVVGDQIAQLPMVFGHEGAGIVEAIGPEVQHVKPGDHVVMSYIPSCGKCYWCTAGKTNLCDLGASLQTGIQLDGTTRFKDENGTVIHQFNLVSTFSEYTVVPADSVVKVYDWYRLDRACLVACGVTAGVGTAIYRGGVKPGSTVMVWGCGGIGMNIIQGARLAGARMIIACDTNDWKLEMAPKFGATHTVNPDKEDAVKFGIDLTWGVGIDYAFEAVATPKTIADAIKVTSKGGVATVIGLTKWDQPDVPFNPSEFVLWHKTLHGSLYGGANPRNDIVTMLRLWETGQIDIEGLVTKEYQLEEINEAYADLLAGKNIRGLIRYPWYTYP
jgi:alcohol dehydrogenase (nicotinoprotein)